MFIDGGYSLLYLDLKDGYGFLPVGCLTSNGFSESTDTLDSTTRDNSGWNTSRLTNQSYNISFDGLVLESAVSFTKNTSYNLTVAKRARTLIDWRVNDKDYGSGYINSISNESSVGENISFSAEIIGYGIPLIKLDFIYDAYKTRVLADGGVMGNEKCLKKYIDSII